MHTTAWLQPKLFPHVLLQVCSTGDTNMSYCNSAWAQIWALMLKKKVFPLKNGANIKMQSELEVVLRVTHIYDWLFLA